MSARPLPIFILLTPLAAVIGGCQSSHPPDTFAQVRSMTADRIGASIRWDTQSQPDLEARRAVERLLARPLTDQDAVQIALLENPNLQATFEEIGIAQADLVAAGLLKNPVFDLSVRFPDRSPSRTYLDFAVAENFLDVFLIPARTKIARSQLAAVRARVSHEVLSLAADTRSAFYAAQAADQIVELRQRLLEAADAASDAARRLREAGNTPEIDYLMEQTQAARAAVELADAQTEAAEAREKLGLLMGVTDPNPSWTIAGRLPDPPPTDPPLDTLLSLAERQRQDLAAAREDVRTRALVYGFTVDTRFWSQLDAGVNAERETDGQWRIGPSVSVPLPLFDQGQAAVPRSAALLRQSEQRYRAMLVQIRHDVRSAHTRLTAARKAIALYRDRILPLQRRLVDQSQLRYNGMFLSVFQLLQSKRDELEAAAQYVHALDMYWTSRTDLERATGSRLPGSLPTHYTPQPASKD